MLRLLKLILMAVCVVAFTSTFIRGEDYSGSARVDSAIWRCRVGETSATLEEHTRITILNPVGISFGNISVFENSFVKVTNLQYSISDATGKVIRKGTKNDLRKHCGFGNAGELYSDNCFYYFEPSAPNYPYTVTCDQGTEFSSLFFLPSLYVFERIPTKYLHVELSYSPKNAVKAICLNLPQPPNTWAESSAPGLSWTFSEIPAIKEIAYIPAEESDERKIIFTPSWFKLNELSVSPLNWKNFGLFYKQLADPRYLAVTNGVPLAHDSAVKTADRICTSTAGEIRYLAVNIGLSGWQPQTAEKTQSFGYGDCKGVTTLLVSRLRQAGIVALPCLVKTSDLGPLDTAAVEYGFNHVITMIVAEPDTFFFDATSQTCPFGVLPELDQGILVLAVTDTGGVLVKTPVISADRNLVVRNTALTVDDSNRLSIDATHALTGQYASSWRNYLRGDDSEDRRLKMQSYFLRGRSHLNLVNYAVSRLDSLEKPLQINATIRSNESTRPIAGVRYLPPFESIAKSIFDDLDLRDRTQSVDLGLPRTIVDSVRIVSRWTTHCDSLKIPTSDSITFDGGATTAIFSRAGDTIQVVLQQEYHDRVVPAQGLAKFGEYLKARRKLLDRPIKWYGSY